MQTSIQHTLEDQARLVSINQLRKFLQSGNPKELGWIKVLSDQELAKEFTLYSQVKRIFEKWQADPNFKQYVLTDPHQALGAYNLDIDCEVIKPLWEPKNCGEEALPLLAKRCREFFHKASHSEASKLAVYSTEPRYKAWRERQIARGASQMAKSLDEQTVHSPICFELSKGCSVGCWFCSVSAPSLSDIFFYTQENAKLWREVLQLLRDMFGVAARAGFCYWATDPLDNPDYERFLCDFHDILGVFPQTTTTQPLKAPTRTRSLLKLSLEKGCKLNRFSILSLKMLNQIHEEFSSEELAFVGLVLQNKETGFVKANAGRMREYNKQQAEKNHEELDDSLPGTNACVTGFLFNMVDRSVKLISPCPANNQWPNGYRVYDEGTFANVDDLRILLERMINKHMPLTLRLSDRIRFRPDFKYQSLPDGFQLSTRFLTLKFRNDPYLKQLGEIIYKGDKTVKDITYLFNVCGIPSVSVLQSLNLMFNKGVLDDEPQP
ncbi:radical SAM family RiPP maturation amino acid epimerase [Nostoc sp. UIC 10607]|uniref:radical SAM family RiPP maturation amino acid epimerase n=1 Tax=Nostoc sp. UIC 10607 TaxID=3045935 RepID=UPI0039A23752